MEEKLFSFIDLAEPAVTRNITKLQPEISGDSSLPKIIQTLRIITTFYENKLEGLFEIDAGSAW